MKILVLSHTRCGSTTLCRWLSKELNCELDESLFYDNKEFDNISEKNNIIRKIVVESYFPTIEEINKFDKVIFLSRKNTNNVAISLIAANKSKDWHSEYEVTGELIEENRYRIKNISNNINKLKRRLSNYVGFHISYEDIYENKSSIDKILEYMNIDNPKHLGDLDYSNRYRKDNNVFITRLI